MPTYQYRCNDCGHEFEEFQSMSDEPIRVCPECQGETRRLITGGAGLIFKGSGFYCTDYRSPTYQAERRKDVTTGSPGKSGSAGASGSTSSSSESKSSGSTGSSDSSNSSGKAKKD